MKSDSWFLTSSAVCRFSTLMVLWGSWENRGKPKLKDSTHLNPEMTIGRHQVCRLNREELQYYRTHVREVWTWKLDLSLHPNWWHVFLFDLSFLRTNWNFWILLMSRDLTMEGENCEAFWVNFPPFLPLHFEHWKLSAKWPALESENEEGSIRNLFGPGEYMRASAEARKMALLTILALIEGRRKGKQKEFNREVETKTAVEISKTIQNNRRCRVKLDQDAPMQNSPAWSVVELTNSQVNQHVAGVAWGFSSSLPFQQRRTSWFVSGEVIPVASKRNPPCSLLKFHIAWSDCFSANKFGWWALAWVIIGVYDFNFRRRMMFASTLFAWSSTRSMPQQALCVLLSETRSSHLLGGNTHTEREPVHGRLLVPKGGSSRSKIYGYMRLVAAWPLSNWCVLFHPFPSFSYVSDLCSHMWHI